jgi:hypothetical protein
MSSTDLGDYHGTWAEAFIDEDNKLDPENGLYAVSLYWMI